MHLTAAIFCNLIIFAGTLLSFVSYFRTEERTWSARKGLASLRFFTTLSNLFSGAAALCWLAQELRMAAGGESAQRAAEVLGGSGFILFKYLATVTVTVTLLTVMLFLGPVAGYGKMLKNDGIYMHLIGPVLAILAFCFFERTGDITIGQSLLGLLPTFLYGVFYLYQAVFRGEEKGGWEDFYGFNAGGKWPLSMVLMHAGTLVICVGLYFLRGVGG